MRRWIATTQQRLRPSSRIPGLVLLCVLASVYVASPANAQTACEDLLDGAPIGSGCIETPDGAFLTAPAVGSDLPGPGASSAGAGFGALIVLAIVVGGGFALWKFFAIRDMGVRRGMSTGDATTAAVFSDNPIMLGMVLKDDATTKPSAETPRRPAPTDENSIDRRLEKIDQLLARGLINEGQAAERKTEILDEI